MVSSANAQTLITHDKPGLPAIFARGRAAAAPHSRPGIRRGRDLWRHGGRGNPAAAGGDCRPGGHGVADFSSVGGRRAVCSARRGESGRGGHCFAAGRRLLYLCPARFWPHARLCAGLGRLAGQLCGDRVRRGDRLQLRWRARCRLWRRGRGWWRCRFWRRFLPCRWPGCP